MIINPKKLKELDVVRLKDGRVGTIVNNETTENILIEISEKHDLVYTCINDIVEIVWEPK